MAKFHLRYSVMNAGKSTQLLQVRHNYIENGGRCLVFTSAIDDRSGVGKISSRLGMSLDAVALREHDDLFSFVSNALVDGPISAVLIDEVQFLHPNHVWQAANIADKLNVPVMAYGLKNNVFGEIFSSAMSVALAIADDIDEIKQVCWCGKKANMILRYGADGKVEKSGSVVEIGAESRYVSVCRKHWVDGEIGPASKRYIERKNTQAA